MSILNVILKKSVFFIKIIYIFLFLIKRPGFYTLQVTRVFSNFPQLKQPNKIKNTCEYCDLLEF